jgi:hypothetical protein
MSKLFSKPVEWALGRPELHVVVMELLTALRGPDGVYNSPLFHGGRSKRLFIGPLRAFAIRNREVVRNAGMSCDEKPPSLDLLYELKDRLSANPKREHPMPDWWEPGMVKDPIGSEGVIQDTSHHFWYHAKEGVMAAIRIQEEYERSLCSRVCCRPLPDEIPS